MAQEDLEIVAGLFPGGDVDMKELVEDEEHWRTIGPLIAPDAEVRFIAPEGGGMGVMGGVFRGTDGFRDGWREWMAAFHSVRLLPRDLVPAPGHRVVVVGEMRAGISENGAELAQQVAGVCRIEEGRIVAMDHYLDPDQARRAAGL